MEATSTPERITKEDIQLKPPLPGGTAIIVQRHGAFIREKTDERAGSLTQDAAEESKEQGAKVFGDMLSALTPEEQQQVDLLILGSDTKYRNAGQRSMETANFELEGIESVLIAHGLVPDEHILNVTRKLRTNGRVRPMSKLREPNMFTKVPEFEKFLLDKYGDKFWEAFEKDWEVETREQMGAEGPKDLGDRLAKAVGVLAVYARVYHSQNQGRRLVIWGVSHYDTISPYIKQYVAKERQGYLPVDNGGGVVININPDGSANTVIENTTYPVAINSPK